MALTESTYNMALGDDAPDFCLLSTGGKQMQLSDFASAEVLVVLFICNHCPYVIHIAPALSRLAKEYSLKNVAFVAINSNDAEAYPADSYVNMQAEVELRGYVFPYLYDESQSVAKAYGAACTPDLFVFDEARKLVYCGQFDETRPNRISSGNYTSADSPATGESLKRVLDALLTGAPLPEKQYPSLGCNIKWRSGNEPQ